MYFSSAITDRGTMVPMRLTAVLLLGWAVLGMAQTLTVTGPPTAAPGSTFQIQINLAGTTGQNLADLEWSLPTGNGVTYSAPTVTPGGAAAGKGVFCTTDNSTCVVVGLNQAANTVSNNAVSDGGLAVLSVTMPASITAPVPFTVSNLVGASTLGAAVPIIPGTLYTIPVPNKCDVNGDGKVDGLDVGIMLNALLGKGACPAGLTCNFASLIKVLIAATGGACTL